MGTRTVHQRARPRVLAWPGSGTQKIDLSKDTVALQTSKSIHGAAGSWSITVLPRQGGKGGSHHGRIVDMERTLRPNSLVSLGFDYDGGLMLGLVDEVRRTRTFAGRRAQDSLTFRGSDLQKVLGRDQIVHAALANEGGSKLFLDKLRAVVGPDHALIKALPGAWGPKPVFASAEADTPTFLSASPAEVIEWLLSSTGAMQVPALAQFYGGSGRAGDFIRSTRYSVTTWNDGRVWSDSPKNFQGTMWDFIRSILDEDFYEFFLDTTRDPFGSAIPFVDLFVRPKPYDEPGLNFLPTNESTGLGWTDLRTRITNDREHEIPLAEVFSESLGFSDADVYSYYLVSSDHTLIGNTNALAEGLFYPAVDTYQLAKAGLRSYRGSLSMLTADLRAKQRGTIDYEREVSADVIEARNRLFNWYRLNDYFEAGTISVAGRDDYRAGDPVGLPWRVARRARFPYGADKGMRYYCVGVDHSWQLGQPYTTQMMLTRGHNTDLLDSAKFEILADAPPTNLDHFAAVNR